MLSFLRNRFFLGGLAALLLVLGFLTFKATRPVQIGDFSKPSLPGWMQTTEKTNFTDTVKYEKDDGNIRYSLYFKVRLNQSSNVPRTSQDIASKVAQDSSRMAAAMAIVGMQYQSGPPIQRTLNGMPAVEKQTLITSKTSVIYGREITFINGSQQYDINANAVLPPGSPSTPPADVVTKRDQAFNTLTQQLTPTK